MAVYEHGSLNTQLGEMTFDERHAVASMDTDNGIGGEDVAAADAMAPPIDTAIDVSHEGGEIEVFSELASEIANRTGWQ